MTLDTKRRYLLGGAVGVGLALVLAMSALFWSVYPSLREAATLGNATLDALARADSEQLRELTGCTECAQRIERQWASLVRNSGKLRYWSFKRISRVFEFGDSEPRSHDCLAPVFELEYEARFEKIRVGTVIVAIGVTEGRYRVIGIRTPVSLKIGW